MLCVIPLLRALRTAFSSSSITLVASPVNYDIMLHNPYADEVLLYDKSTLFPDIRNVSVFIRALKSKSYDITIVPSTVSISTTSNAIAWLSGAAIRIGPKSVGTVRNNSPFFFTQRVRLDWSSSPHRHQTLRNLDIVQPLGITSDDLTCAIGYTVEESRAARLRLTPMRSERKLIVGMHPGAGKSANRWGAEKFAAVANDLHEKRNAGIVITAGYRDADAVRGIQRHLRCPFTLIENEPIRQVASIIDQLDLFISNDTGIMHIAGASKPPTLSLFGPTDPLQWAPIGKKNRFVSSRDGDIDSIGVEEVSGVIERMLTRN